MNRKDTERRQYQRFDLVFPVEFQLLSKERQELSGWVQGFTQDVGEGGLCLVVNHLSVEHARCLEGENFAALRIHVPASHEGFRALAKIAWFQKTKSEPVSQYVLGLAYEEIHPQAKKGIAGYLIRRKVLRFSAVGLSVLLGLGLVLSGLKTARLQEEKAVLVSDLSRGLEERQILTADRDRLTIMIDEAEFLLSQASRKSLALEERSQEVSGQDEATIAQFKKTIEELKKDRVRIKERLGALVAKRQSVDEDVGVVSRKVAALEGRVVDKMYGWLENHQNSRTGLVTSFEGDEEVADWAFTYDQALAAIVFARRGDLERSEEILRFYERAQKIDGGAFLNAYYASNGEAAEFVAHAGPNIWLGLAVCHHARLSRSKQFIEIARSIADWLVTIRDAEGGLRGGKSVSWYSTEHNLDAYAFYGMMFDLTGEKKYQDFQSETLSWLKENSYTQISAAPVNRGKGDATIATDTYAWSIAALSPGRLSEIGMDPDQIMQFAIDHCQVSAQFKNNRGEIASVKGFDFAKAQHLSRGGIVSSEWTSQMILSFKIMGDYHESAGRTAEAGRYFYLADLYTGELGKMLTVSPSPTGQGGYCLPYASAELADTGHGWRTPRGARTGSVAGTAYAILAIDGYNPLK